MNTQIPFERFFRIKVPWISLLACLAGIIISILKLPDVSESQLLVVAGTMTSLGGTLLGFLIAALAILSAVMDRRLLVNMKKTGHYEQLLQEMFLCSTAFLVVMGLSLFCLFLKLSILLYLMSIAVGFMALALTLLVTAGYHFYLVMINIE